MVAWRQAQVRVAMEFDKQGRKKARDEKKRE